MWDMPWKLYDEIVVITIAMHQQHRRSPFCCNAAINLMIYEKEREKKKKQSSRSNATLSVCCYSARDTICRFIIFHLLNWFSFGPKWQTEPRRIMNIWSRASTAILAIAPALNHILCFALDSFSPSLHCIALHPLEMVDDDDEHPEYNRLCFITCTGHFNDKLLAVILRISYHQCPMRCGRFFPSFKLLNLGFMLRKKKKKYR